MNYDFASCRYGTHRLSSAKLAGIKHGLYNPRLPTLRRMDRDDAMNKLPTEHSRTTTHLKKGDFMKGRSSSLAQGGPGIHGKNSMQTDVLKMMHNYQQVPLHENHHTAKWNQILGRLNIKPDEINGKTEFSVAGVSGLCVRKKHPDITSSWQFSRPDTALGNDLATMQKTNRSKQLPAALYSRYRGCASNKSNPWR